MKFISRKEGFTLIELLVVIAVIGILAAVVLASLKSARDKSKMTKALSTMQEINKVAYNCLIENKALSTLANGSVGGTEICPGAQNLPDITDTGFLYCGTACGGWVSNGSTYYAISIYSDNFPGGRKAVICGVEYNSTTWFASLVPSANFIGKGGCVKAGF